MKTKTGVLAGLASCTLLPSLATSIANVALPTLADAFGASVAQAQWVVIAYLLATTTLIVAAGGLGDVLGRRRLLLAGVVVFTVASAACAAAPSLGLLIAARVVQGTGAALMLALSLALAGEAVPSALTGRAMGLLGTMSALGTALGPSLGGLLIAQAGWRAVFVVLVPLGLVTVLLAHGSLPAGTVSSARVRLDLAGTALLAATLGAYALAMTRGAHWLAIAATAGWMFVRVERRHPSPLLRLAWLGDRGLRAGLAASALAATVVMATLVVGPFHLSRGLGLGAAVVGLAMSVGPLGAALSGVPAGRLVDQFGTGPMTVAGLGGMFLGCLVLGLSPAAGALAGYVVSVLVVTASFALFQTANNTGVMAGVPAARRGVISGMLNLSRNLGLVTGATLMTAVFAAASAEGGATAGVRGTFLVAAALLGLGLAMARPIRLAGSSERLVMDR